MVMRKVPMREGLQKIDGIVVNAGEGGKAFYHKHLSPKARKKKKKLRVNRRRAKRKNNR